MLAPVLYEVELKRNKQRMERTEGVMVAEVDGEEWRWELQLRGEGYALSHSQMRISNHKFSACSWPGLDCEGRCRLPDPFFFKKCSRTKFSPSHALRRYAAECFPFSPPGKIFVSPLTNIVARAETPARESVYQYAIRPHRTQWQPTSAVTFNHCW